MRTCSGSPLRAVRQRGALRGVRLIDYNSVVDYLRRSTANSVAGIAKIELPTDEAAARKARAIATCLHNGELNAVI